MLIGHPVYSLPRPPLLLPPRHPFRSGFQRYLGDDGKAAPQDRENDAVRTGRGPRAGDGVLLHLPDVKSHEGQLQTSSSGWRLCLWEQRNRQETILNLDSVEGN